jgi:phosphoglycolate phosphatase
MGLIPLLGFIAGYDSGYGSKPDPGMVTAFAEQHALATHEVALVGDSLHDLVAARAAGAVSVAVLTGPRKRDAAAELERHADHVLGSIADLLAILKSATCRTPSVSRTA